MHHQTALEGRKIKNFHDTYENFAMVQADSTWLNLNPEFLRPDKIFPHLSAKLFIFSES